MYRAHAGHARNPSLNADVPHTGLRSVSGPSTQPIETEAGMRQLTAIEVAQEFWRLMAT